MLENDFHNENKTHSIQSAFHKDTHKIHTKHFNELLSGGATTKTGTKNYYVRKKQFHLYRNVNRIIIHSQNNEDIRERTEKIITKMVREKKSFLFS